MKAVIVQFVTSIIICGHLDAMETMRRFAIDSGVTALASCPDGQFITIGLEEGNVGIIDTHTGKTSEYEGYNTSSTAFTTAPCTAHKNSVTALAIQKNNVVIGYQSGSAVVLDHVTNRSWEIARNDAPIRRIVIDAPLIVTASDDSIVKAWDIDTGKCLSALQMENNVYALALSAAHKLFCVPAAKDILVWDIKANKKMHLLSGHEGCISALVLKGVNLWSGSYDGTLCFWDINSGVCKKIISHFGYQIDALSLKEENRTLIGASNLGYGFAWDVTKGILIATLFSSVGNVQKVAVGGNKIITTSENVEHSDGGERVEKKTFLYIRPIAKLSHAYVPVINELPYPLEDITVVDSVNSSYNGRCSCGPHNCSQLGIFCRNTVTGYDLKCTCSGQQLKFRTCGTLIDIKKIIFTEDIVTGKIVLKVETNEELASYLSLQQWAPNPLNDNDLNLSVYTCGKTIKSITLRDNRENIIVAQASIAKKIETDQITDGSTCLWEIVGSSHYGPYKLTVVTDDAMVYEWEIQFLSYQTDLLISIPPACLPEPPDWYFADEPWYAPTDNTSSVPQLTLYMEASKQIYSISLPLTSSVAEKI